MHFYSIPRGRSGHTEVRTSLTSFLNLYRDCNILAPVGFTKHAQLSNSAALEIVTIIDALVRITDRRPHTLLGIYVSERNVSE